MAEPILFCKAWPSSNPSACCCAWCLLGHSFDSKIEEKGPKRKEKKRKIKSRKDKRKETKSVDINRLSETNLGMKSRRQTVPAPRHICLVPVHVAVKRGHSASGHCPEGIVSGTVLQCCTGCMGAASMVPSATANCSFSPVQSTCRDMTCKTYVPQSLDMLTYVLM